MPSARLVAGPVAGTVAAHDLLAVGLDDREVTVPGTIDTDGGRGPCVEAFRARHVVDDASKFGPQRQKQGGVAPIACRSQGGAVLCARSSCGRVPGDSIAREARMSGRAPRGPTAATWANRGQGRHRDAMARGCPDVRRSTPDARAGPTTASVGAWRRTDARPGTVSRESCRRRAVVRPWCSWSSHQPRSSSTAVGPPDAGGPAWGVLRRA